MTLEAWTELLSQAGAAHHRAFSATDGEDPDWPSWYAAWLLERLPEPAPEIDEPQLAVLLANAAETHKTSGSEEDWPGFYARFITGRLQG
jgi:hypothetical protein